MQHDYILLDRSGSMDVRWTEALNAINGYVNKLLEEKVNTAVTVAVFDTPIGGGGLDFKVIRDEVVPSAYKPITNEDATPRNGTPLNDAIGRMVSIAEAKGGERAAIIVMTDGYENSSREHTQASAKAALERCRKKGWQVIMLGADFDNTAQSAGYGTVGGQTISVGAAHFSASMNSLGSKRAFYGVTGQNMAYTDDEKKQFAPT